MPHKKNPDWDKVFKLATSVAKALREKDPKLSVTDAAKKAWKTKEVKEAHEAYNKKKALKK